ncbi:MAG: FAD-dependent oxidoreductase [Bacilli bacterium]|nr:FAD-dependent oxidoreductase [Bacilli bacterium]
MNSKIYDVLIIGAGVTGTMIARELSKYCLDVAILDKNNDAGDASSSSNSAIIHSGYDPEPGTLKAKFNVLGNAKYPKLVEELDVPFNQCGSLTIAVEDEQLPILKELAERSKINGVEVKLLSKEEVIAMEPNINPEVKGALFAPTAGIIDPFNLVVHAMENAIDNGVTFLRSHEVLDIKKQDEIYLVKTNKGDLFSRIVINAAGVKSDKIAMMVEDIDWAITPRKGEYYVLDHYAEGLVNHTIFPLPSKKGKGVLVSMTTSGNYIVGPSSELADPDDLSTDSETLANIKKAATLMVPSIPFKETIRVFSGLRATCTRHDFIIEYAKSDNHFINVAGIESPGFVSSPAIAEYVVETLIRPLITLKSNTKYNPCIKKYHRMFYLSDEEKLNIIKENPEYGQMVCNCEHISLGEINDALSRSCPPVSIKGMKRRTRAGYGRCQGGFCQPRALLIMARHYGVSPKDIPLAEDGSYIIDHEVKEVE